MRRRTHFLLAGAAAAGLGPWLPGWLAAAGLDAWNAPALARAVAAGRTEEARLTDELAGMRDLARAKEALADEFIAGRLTLAEATDQFAALVADKPRILDGLRKTHRGAPTDREVIARHVIAYARYRLGDAAGDDRLAARMATEFESLFPPRPAAASAPTMG